MSTGVIKKLVTEKAFGFITPDDKVEGDRDLFFHKNAVVEGTYEDLHEGDKVSFDTEKAEKGPQAVNVRRV